MCALKERERMLKNCVINFYDYYRERAASTKEWGKIKLFFTNIVYDFLCVKTLNFMLPENHKLLLESSRFSN